MLGRSLAFAPAAALAGLAVWVAGRGGWWWEGEHRALGLASAAELWVLAAAAAVAVGALAWGRGKRRWVALGAVGLGTASWVVAATREGRPPVAQAAELGELPAAGPRLLWVGIDGMTWSRALPLARRGRMPNLRALLEEGASATLVSHRTYRRGVDKWGWWSPVVWTSMATGRTAEHHGVTDFTLPAPGGRERPGGRPDRRAASSFHRRVPAFWNVASAFGRPVGVVGWWGSWPAEDIEGVLVTDRVGLRGRHGGTGAPGEAGLGDPRGLTDPPEFVETLLGEIGLPPDPGEWMERELYPFRERPMLGPDRLRTLEGVLWQDQLYVRVGAHLLARRPELGLVTVYIEGLDAVSHHFFAYTDPRVPRPSFLPGEGTEVREVVDRAYATLDHLLGELLAAAGPETAVLVTSDHGFRVTGTPPADADHSGFGVLVARGRGIRAGWSGLSLAGSLAEAVHGPIDVMDVLPTVLYWQGLPVAADLDGTVAYRLFDPEFLAGRPEVRVPSYAGLAPGRGPEIEAPADEREYRDRLQALGYVQ